MDNKHNGSKGSANQLGSFSIEAIEDAVMRYKPVDVTNVSREKGEAEKTAIVVLKIVGTIDLLTASEFQQYAMNYISKGIKYILLDFTRLDFIDSMGLSTVLMLYQKLVETGGRMLIINPKPSIMVVLKITKVNQKILVFATLDEAKACIANDGWNS